MRITEIFGYLLRIETSGSTFKLTWLVWKKTWTERSGFILYGRRLDSAQLAQVEMIPTGSFMKIDFACRPLVVLKLRWSRLAVSWKLISLVVRRKQNWRVLERWWTVTEFPMDNVRIPYHAPLPFLLRCCWVGFADVILIIDEERSDVPRHKVDTHEYRHR